VIPREGVERKSTFLITVAPEKRGTYVIPREGVER
jgi:hypothetical protein